MMTRPVRSSPSATASRFGRPVVVRLLDPREQEDAVVGREPEGDREQQHGLRQLERALAPVVEQPLEPAVLEDEARARRRRRRGRAGSSRAPSAAAPPSRVTTNRSAKVVTASSASARAAVPQACGCVQVPRGLAADRARRGAAQLRTSAFVCRSSRGAPGSRRPTRAAGRAAAGRDAPSTCGNARSSRPTRRRRTARCSGASSPGANCVRSTSSTCRALELAGSTDASTPMKRTPRNGSPSTTSSVADADGDRTPPGASHSARSGTTRRARPAGLRARRRAASAAARARSRAPRAARRARAAASATSPASGATITPPIAIERRNAEREDEQRSRTPRRP